MKNLSLDMKGRAGFTLIEVLIATVILTTGVLGLASLTTTVIKGARFSERMTQAATLAEEKMEEIKRIGTDEAQAGVSSLGFAYLVSGTGYLSTLYDNGTNGDQTAGDGIYTSSDTSGNITRRWILEPYPSGGSNPTFAAPSDVTAVKVTVVCNWTDMTGTPRSVTFETLIGRRQIVGQT